MDKKITLRNTFMTIGIILVGLVGLFFVLYVDLYLSGNSKELFVGIFFPLASIVFLVLAESFKHKPVVFYIMKIFAVLLAAGFVVYAFYFMTRGTYINGAPKTKLFREYAEDVIENGVIIDSNKYCVTVFSGKFLDGSPYRFDKAPAYIGMIVTSIVGTIAVAGNVVMNKLVGLD